MQSTYTVAHTFGILMYFFFYLCKNVIIVVIGTQNKSLQLVKSDCWNILRGTNRGLYLKSIWKVFQNYSNFQGNRVEKGKIEITKQI